MPIGYLLLFIVIAGVAFLILRNIGIANLLASTLRREHDKENFDDYLVRD